MPTGTFHFQSQTTRFLRRRWLTDAGRTVHRALVEAIARGDDLTPVLAPHVVEQEVKYDATGHPVFLPSKMSDDTFWVLNERDLRGIAFIDQDFRNSESLKGRNLGSAQIIRCDLSHASLKFTALSHIRIEDSRLDEVDLSTAGGEYMTLLRCSLRGAILTDARFTKTALLSCDLRGAYLESVRLEEIHINHMTQFDRSVRSQLGERRLSNEEHLEILKTIRRIYETNGIWHQADDYLYLERTTRRKYMLWPLAMRERHPSQFIRWLRDYSWAVFTGYGLMPFRLITVGIVVSLLFTLLYYFAGNPVLLKGQPSDSPEFLTSLYYSMTTFATLGYGDLAYASSRYVMRILSTVEAWVGAILIALFVAVVSRKLFR